ncbi:hypothetical protein [Ancylobacter sp.]|uniref:hypothetical protein n=1 Tax=Ancylobacter sp. TaxID=1872567 RepID=UPI003C7BF601
MERYVALLDKSMNLMGQLAREEDNTSALAMQVIEFLGNYNAMSGSYEDDVDQVQLKEP